MKPNNNNISIIEVIYKQGNLNETNFPTFLKSVFGTKGRNKM